MHRKGKSTKTGDKIMCIGRLSCSTTGSRLVTLVTLSDKSRMRQGPDFDNDKRNISVFICDTDIP